MIKNCLGNIFYFGSTSIMREGGLCEGGLCEGVIVGVSMREGVIVGGSMREIGMCE